MKLSNRSIGTEYPTQKHHTTKQRKPTNHTIWRHNKDWVPEET